MNAPDWSLARGSQGLYPGSTTWDVVFPEGDPYDADREEYARRFEAAGLTSRAREARRGLTIFVSDARVLLQAEADLRAGRR